MEILGLFFKILFCLILGFAVLHALVTHFVLLYEMRLSALANHSTFTISPWVFIKSLCTEIFCNFIRIWLIPFLGFPYKTELDDLSLTQSKTPILLVHGYGQNQMDWIWFRYQLKHKQVGPIYSINLTPPFASISDLAELVKQRVTSIQQETQQSHIILIGHSMGGLVSCYYAEFLAKPGDVLTIITLGSPFQGTKLAALGYGKNVKEMAPHSPFLKEITQRIQHSSIQYHHVASKMDNIIVPWESALPLSNTANDDQLILDDHGHLQLLISPKVIAQVVKWIQQ